MSIPRIVIGRRGTEYGVFVSPPSVNAMTASAASLTLSLGYQITQMVIVGSALANKSVVFNYDAPPHVLLTAGPITQSGMKYYGQYFLRPYPSPVGFIPVGATTAPLAQAGTSGYATVTRTSMRTTYNTKYIVFRRTFD